jgi:Holliday junction DNA helicase RuvB
MAIKSTKKIEETERIIAPKEKDVDLQNDVKLRPKKIEDYVGQDSIKKHLKISIGSAQIRNEPLEHVLLY